jgi:hypothetical protein
LELLGFSLAAVLSIAYGSGRAGRLFQKNWDAWKAWAKLEEVP